MSSYFSTPAFHAQRELNAIGVTLNRGQILEVQAALFGYHHFQEMQPDLASITYHLENNAPWVVLQADMGLMRLSSLGMKWLHQQALQIIQSRLPIQYLFRDDNHFLIEHFVGGVFRDWVLADGNEEIWQAQQKIEHRCDVFVRDDVDFGDLINERAEVWEGSVGAQLHQRRGNGSVAYDDKYINIGARIRFQKLGRVLLEPDAKIALGATAVLPQGGMGGIEL